MKHKTLAALDQQEFGGWIHLPGAITPLDDEPDQFMRKCANCGQVRPVCCETTAARCERCCQH